MENTEKFDLKRLISVLNKNKVKIILTIILFIVFGCFYSYNLVTPKYKSTSTILLANNDSGTTSSAVTQTEVQLNKSLVSTYSNILKSNNVLSQVIDNLGLDMATDELEKNVEIKDIKDTQIIEVSVIDLDAANAQKIATELNNVFMEEIRNYYKIDNINIVDEASFETEPYNINHARDIMIFFAAGVIASMALIFVIFLLDTTAKIERDIEEFVGINVVGAVPKYKGKLEQELIVNHSSKSVISEALKTIRTNITFTKSNENANTILFTSCNAGEGKSWVASNMAVAYAQSNKNVILVDADMRKGRQDVIFGVDNARGLSGCLDEISSNEDFEIVEKYIKETEISKVHIMTLGAIPPNPSELLASKKIEYLIQMLRCVYDIIIIDGTPCNLVADIIPVSRLVDTTVIVTESRRTKIEDLRNVVKSISNAQGKIAGAILNKKEVEGKGYYGKGYGYYGKGYYGKSYYGKSEDLNAKIEVQSYTVRELFENKKEFIEDVVEEFVSKKQSSKFDILEEKLNSLEDKLLKIPDINLETYTKMVGDIREIYENELDKNDLALEIRDSIVNNEVITKLEQQNARIETGNMTTRKLLAEKMKQLDYNNDIDSLFNKIVDIEKAIGEDTAEENIINMIDKMRQEQEERFQALDNSKYLVDILDQIQEVKTAQEENLEEIIVAQEDKLEESNIELKNLIEEKITNVLSEIERVIISANSEQKLIDMLEKIKEENNQKIESIDNSGKIEEIMLELKKINNRYDKLAEKIKQNSNNSKPTEEENVKQSKNNVIKLEEAKSRMKHEELIIEYGKEVAYEELLDLAIGVYEIGQKSNNLKRKVK